MATTSAPREKRSETAGADAGGRARAPDRAAPLPQNQELQALFATGALRAQLQVGAADDPAEAQADRVADAVMAGASCPLCAAGASPCPSCAAKARRKPRAGAAPAPGGVSRLGLGDGRALAPRERSRFESAFGMDLGDVRVHDDARAARNADAMAARAFSVGEHVAFAAGEHQPHTPEGQRLLAHELAHVALGHGGVRRQAGGVCSESAGVCEAPPVEAGASRITDPATVEHDAGFDPCRLDVATLTNYQLLAEYANAMRMIAPGRDAPHYFDWRNLQRRLVVERDARIDRGHAWLASMPSAVPERVLQIVDGPGGTFTVLSIPGSAVAGRPEGQVSPPYMNQSQFDRFLTQQAIERVDAHTYMLRTQPQGTGLTPPFLPGGLAHGPALLPLLFPPRPQPPLGPIAWPPLTGALGNPGMLSGHPLAIQRDMLTSTPQMDPATSERLARLIALYRSQPGVPGRPNPLFETGPVETGTVAIAMTDIPNLQSTPFPGASAQALPEALRGTPGTTGGSVLTPVNPTAVNHAEHVALENLRRAIELAIAQGRLTRSQLRGRSVTVLVEQEPCSSCASGSGAEGASGVLQQFAELYPELTIEVRNQRTSRTYVYRGGRLLNPSTGTPPPTTPTELPAPSRPSVDAFFTPEYVTALRMGGGWSGDLRAGGLRGAQGAGMSAFIAVGVSGVVMAFDSQSHPEWGTELALTGGLGAGSGFVGSSVDQIVASRLTGRMVTDIALTGSSRLSPAMATGLGRAAGGAAGAMFVEGISMGLLEEREHSGAEVGVRLGRSGALGAGSVWAGAAIGTAIGGPVGFIVGLGIGAGLYYLGDRVVPGGRADWDAYEAGCQPPPPRPSSSDRLYVGACFEACTPVLLADGTELPIEAIAPGDVVLSWHERDDCLQPRAVTAVHVGDPALMLGVRLTDGGRFAATAPHKLHTPQGWRALADLRPGDLLQRAADDRLASVAIAAIEPLPAGTLVYDLGVEGTHTYFAAGILAHNKNA